jgi:hypothetical protein
VLGGLGLMTVGVGSGLLSVFQWTNAGLSGLDPAVTMRAAIPAAALIMAGAECVAASFVLSFINQPRAVAPAQAFGASLRAEPRGH